MCTARASSITASDHTDKVWWVQAEMVAALTDALLQRDEPRYATALAQLLAFVERHQIDRADGVWLHAVTERGGRRLPRKSGASRSVTTKSARS